MRSIRPAPAQERAFLQSVVYASLFDYPLTRAQLCEGLIGESADEATIAGWYAASPRLQAAVERHGDYYFPRGHRHLLATRLHREALSRQLLLEMRGPIRLVKAMPFVRMVAVSGSLAHLNAEGGADLDLFVVTTPGRVWSVTLTTLIVARLLGWRKRLCLNYVVSERALMVGPADLFSANQIVHLQPLSGADTYRRFLAANRFVARFYPNFRPRPVEPVAENLASVSAKACVRVLAHVFDWTVAPLYERICRSLYKLHLRRRAHTWRSRDQVRLEAECLKLHTSSHRREVMERFEHALEEALSQAEADALTREESSPVRAAR